MFKNLVISGAAMKIVSIVGVYTAMSEHKITENIINYIGSSSGALVCFLLALGCTSTELKKYIHDGIHAYNKQEISIDNIFKLYSCLGIDNASYVINVVQNVLFEKHNVTDISFIDFAKLSGKNLIICVSNITTSKNEFWSVDTQPNLSVITALKASIAIPILYYPISYKDCLYCDGAMFDHFPIKAISIVNPEFKDTLGICVKDFYTDKENKESKEKVNLVKYIFMLIKSLLKNINYDSICDAEKNNIVVSLEIPNEIEPYFDYKNLKFTIDDDLFNKLYDYGYNTANEYFKLCFSEQSF
jgi:predicted acylesterase/phospholipase RssA